MNDTQIVILKMNSFLAFWVPFILFWKTIEKSDWCLLVSEGKDFLSDKSWEGSVNARALPNLFPAGKEGEGREEKYSCYSTIRTHAQYVFLTMICLKAGT